jgi:fused signal recognition particle receptor
LEHSNTLYTTHAGGASKFNTRLEVLLVLDATSGQNAIIQAEMFKKTINCTGIILAKLDGTAKGGAIFGVKQKLNMPVKFVGVGEQLDDLEIFDPNEYVEKLFED